MAYKTILVSLNDLDRIDEIAGLACKLALEYDAHLIGVFVIPVMPVFPVPGAFAAPEMFEAYEAMFSNWAKAAEERFEEIAAACGIQREWRLVSAHASIIANSLIDHGHQADLLVIGQNGADSGYGIETDFANRVILETGRPVMVVPNTGSFETVGERVLVGWNATREAARAVSGSLPILQSAKEVWLTWIDPQDEPISVGEFPGSELSKALSRHGVRVTSDPVKTDNLNTGPVLQVRGEDHRADLIVTGAYGHSRLREFVLGGVTRHLLNHMTVPVLMAH